MSFCIVLSGDWGCGKTATAVSFRPFGFPKTQVPKRLVIDPELRAGPYKSGSDKDDPKHLQWAFDVLSEKQFNPLAFHNLMQKAHQETWENKPDVVIIDDTQTVQDKLSAFWDQPNTMKQTAAIYGMDNHSVFGYNASVPAKINFKKKLLSEFMMDLRAHGIDLIISSPLRNVWQDYGKKGINPIDHLPYMRIIGQTAAIWDCFEKFADVIWILDRRNDDGSLKVMPQVKMDLFIAKASMPGVAEQFNFTSWAKIWEWHEKREFTADLSKLKMDAPSFTPEQIDEAIKRGKQKLVAELDDIPVEDIKAIMTEEGAPEYGLDNHEEIKKYIRRVLKERQ